MKTFSRLAIALVVLGAGGWAGCGTGSKSALSGKVLLDGKPVNKAQVQFLLKDSAGGMHSATTDADGNFSLVEDASSNNPIKPGSYVVLVTKLSGGMGEMANEIPSVYQDRNSTPLSVEIESAKTQLPPFELTSTPAKSPAGGKTK